MFDYEERKQQIILSRDKCHTRDQVYTWVNNLVESEKVMIEQAKKEAREEFAEYYKNLLSVAEVLYLHLPHKNIDSEEYFKSHHGILSWLMGKEYEE